MASELFCDVIMVYIMVLAIFLLLPLAIYRLAIPLVTFVPSTTATLHPPLSLALF